MQLAPSTKSSLVRTWVVARAHAEPPRLTMGHGGPEPRRHGVNHDGLCTARRGARYRWDPAEGRHLHLTTGRPRRRPFEQGVADGPGRPRIRLGDRTALCPP